MEPHGELFCLLQIQEKLRKQKHRFVCIKFVVFFCLSRVHVVYFNVAKPS